MNDEQQPKKKPDTRPVFSYIMILFIVAFLLMAYSFLAHQRSNSQALGEVRDSLNSMGTLDDLHTTLGDLESQRAELEDALDSLEEENRDLEDRTEELEEIIATKEAEIALLEAELARINQPLSETE